MRHFKLLTLNAAIMATVCCSLALGQTTVPSSRFIPGPAESPEATSPLTEFGAFDYDAQMFAPYDLRDLAEPSGPIGFYFTYDRVYTSVSKPGIADNIDPDFAILVPTGSNYAWGNRFEAGVMNANCAGWGGEFTYHSGSFFSAGQDILVSNPVLTTTSVHNFKLNRVFRQELERGGWIEPYFGFRFIGISDNTIEDSTITFNGTASFDRFKQNATNSAAGAHVGARHVRRAGRWGTSVDASLAATYNGQRYLSSNIITSGATISIFETTLENSAFCPVLDLRGDLSYAMTRDLAFRLGCQLLYVWDGVNRADTLPSIFNPNSALGPGGVLGISNESLVTAGFNFGVEWRR